MCKICFCKKKFQAYDQTIIDFISLKNENKDSKDNSVNSNNLQEPHDSDDDVTIYGDFSKNNQNNHVCRNHLDGFLGMCDPSDVELDDISESNSEN